MSATAEIKCAHSEIRKLADLREHPRNPNRHPPEQLRLLGKVIVASGWRAPIVVSKRSGLVIKGHGRLQAAKLAGLTEAPVDLQDYADEASEWADMVADNRLAELAEMDLSALNELLDGLSRAGMDLELAGWPDGENGPVDLVPFKIVPPPTMSWTLIGIPLVRYSVIARPLEEIAKLADVLFEQTHNDG